MQSTGNAFKKVTYDYDLISGKVNNVSYQPGEHDQFHHRYEYDAENRITKVHTSGDGVIWETDARYYYYRHGPLARTETGDLLVQGTDYAYTLQGWLKGVNSSALDPAHDMGEDGSSTSIVARDVYGFALHYYNTDFTQINTSKTVFAPVNTTALTGFKPLFNGNIAAMAVNIGHFDRPLIYNYGYDQLNRLVAMDAYTGLNSSTNAWTPVSTDDYKERISYDGNGNIIAYLRNGTTLNSRPQTMDELTYGYNLDGSGRLLNNRLRHVKDAVSAGNYTTDIDDQGDDNYAYDEIGNLISDDQEGISEITWNVYGKISSITKSGPVTISYDYDASGNRIGKTVGNKHTWYVRDASGNVMAVYEDENSSINGGALSQIEVHLYGSARLGMWQANRDVENWPAADVISLTGLSEGGVREKQIRGEKIFELSNHLGSVLVTISDKNIGVDQNTDGTIDYYNADVIIASDMYPGGMIQPGRSYNSSQYRYGLMGKEKSDEIYGEGDTYNFGDRIQDPRLVKWFSTDPLQMKYPGTSPYVFCGNNPIFYVDPDGRVLQFYGDAKEFRKTEALINNKFAGSNVKVTIGTNGIMTITGDTKKLNSQQLALYNSLNTVITSKGTTNMYALKSSERQNALGGSFSGNKDAGGNDQSITVGGVKKNAQFYDVYDMEALDKNKADGISGVSDLAHEIYEAYMYQDQKITDFTKAHNAALKVQGDVDGYTNVQNTSVQGSGIMNVTYTTADGRKMRSDLPYSRNDWSGASTTMDITPPPPPTRPKPQIAPPAQNTLQGLNMYNDRLINRTGPTKPVQPMGGW